MAKTRTTGKGATSQGKNSKETSKQTTSKAKRKAAALPTNKNKKKKAAPLPPLRGSTAAPVDPDEVENPGKGKGKRPPNFSTVEDVYLCKAYVSVTENSRVGADQAADKFWGDIYKTWFKLMSEDSMYGKDFTPRNPEALKNRFQRAISKGVQYFNGYYKRSKEKERTGWTNENYIKEAMDKFQHDEGKPFLFSECVPILHAIPKFSPDYQAGQTGDKTINSLGTAMGSDKPRPMGQKEAKKQEKKKDSTTVASMETAKVEQLQSLATATKKVATAVNRKSERDSLMQLARMHLDLGEVAEAKKIMDEMKERMKQEEADDEQEKEKQATSAPLSETTVEDGTGNNNNQQVNNNQQPNEEAPSVGSGHVQTEREIQQTAEGDLQEVAEESEEMEEEQQQEEKQQEEEGSEEEEDIVSDDTAIRNAKASLAKARASKDYSGDDSSSDDQADKAIEIATQKEAI